MPKNQALSKASLAVLEHFRQRPDVEDEHYQTLVSAIKASPLLTERFNLAVANQYLAGIKAQGANENSGGGFHPDTQEISLPLNSLKKDTDQNSMIFVLAHEVQHSFNRQESQDAADQFLQDIQIQAQQPGMRDYTDEIQALITANRKDEASAEIAGFNAVISTIKMEMANPTLRDIHDSTSYMRDFIVENETDDGYTYTLKPDIILNKDMMLSTTPEDLPKNLEAMGRHYFDKDRNEARLGICDPTGCQPDDYVDYTNYHGAWMVGRAIDAERRHNPGSTEPLVLDMRKLRLTEEMLEESGLFIEGGKPMPYKDIGQNPPFVGRFDHTASGKNQYQYVPVGALDEKQPQPGQTHIDALIARYQAASAALDAGNGSAVKNIMGTNPDVAKIMERFDSGLERRQMLREQENSRYSLENMPERAQTLHTQIEEKLTAYAKEHNLPYSSPGLQNSIAAITAEAYAQKLTRVDAVSLHGGKLAVMQEGRATADFASVDAARASLTPESESFQNILQSEQRLEQEARQRETELQTEQTRGMSMRL